MEEIKVNEKAVERLKRKIILQESQNLKTREKNGPANGCLDQETD